MKKQGIEPLETKSLGITPSEQEVIEQIAALHPGYPVGFRFKNAAEAAIAFGCYVFENYEKTEGQCLGEMLNLACREYGVRGGFQEDVPAGDKGGSAEIGDVS